jgi:hypothetical protein
MNHESLDQRSLELHRRVAQKLRQNPFLLARAVDTLERWRANAPTQVMPYLDEWKYLLDAGLEECLSIAVEESERATALRQNSPLSCLLSPSERWEFLKEWKRHYETREPGTHHSCRSSDHE